MRSATAVTVGLWDPAETIPGCALRPCPLPAHSTMTSQNDRRASGARDREQMLAELNPEQRVMLQDLEQSGWQLALIRHPGDGPIVPVAMIPGSEDFIVLDPQGWYSQPEDFRLRRARQPSA